MRILFIAPSIPYPPHTGGQLRSWHFLRFLATQGKVTLVAMGDPAQCAPYISELQKYCARIFIADIKKFGNSKEQSGFSWISNRIHKLSRFEPWLLDDFVDEEIKRQIHRAHPESFNLIVVRYAPMAYHFFEDRRLKKLLSRVVLDADDISTISQERKRNDLKFGYKRFRQTLDLWFLKKYYRNLKKVKACFAVSLKEKKYLDERGWSKRTFLVPNVIEVNGQGKETRDGLTNSKMLFCGMMSYPPNQEAVYYFCDEIFPLILKEVPNAGFRVVGNRLPEKMKRLGQRPGIHIEGYVPSLEPYYNGTALVVVPLLNGAGTRIKILEAMAYKKAVVSTSIGAEGLEIRDGENIVIGDSPKEFAGHCVALLRNPVKRTEIGRKAYELVKERYDFPVFEKKMEEIINWCENAKR